jgi:hypothetical protein
LGRTPDVKFQSLKLIEECLRALGFADDHARAIVEPLKETRELRNKVKGHASGADGITVKKQLLKEHGSYKNHFRALCGKCDESIRAIAEALKQLK